MVGSETARKSRVAVTIGMVSEREGVLVDNTRLSDAVKDDPTLTQAQRGTDR